jgi:hypothetical protein
MGEGEPMSVNDYTTGKFLGRADIDEENYNANAQWPQGTILAGDILSDEEIDKFGITSETIVYCD